MKRSEVKASSLDRWIDIGDGGEGHVSDTITEVARYPLGLVWVRGIDGSLLYAVCHSNLPRLLFVKDLKIKRPKTQSPAARSKFVARYIG